MIEIDKNGARTQVLDGMANNINKALVRHEFHPEAAKHNEKFGEKTSKIKNALSAAIQTK